MTEPNAGRGGGSAHPQKWPKLFTLEEANRAISMVERTFQWLDERRAELAQLGRSVEVLELITASGASESSADHAQFEETKSRFDTLVDEMHAELGHLTDMGIVLRDLETGLVDFHALRDGKIVFLCWRRGEDAISFWHDIEAGFAGREPINSD